MYKPTITTVNPPEKCSSGSSEVKNAMYATKSVMLISYTASLIILFITKPIISENNIPMAKPPAPNLSDRIIHSPGLDISPLAPVYIRVKISITVASFNSVSPLIKVVNLWCKSKSLSIDTITT